uniref:Heparinase II/III-family protein n=1 Tax=Prevotella sp. GTC17262 TaxID=3236797 RepID=A0AB33JM96_9BACT
MHNIIRYSLLALILLCSVSGSAYTERNLLGHQISKETLKEALVINQKWVSYPAYSDRSGWDKLFGASKEAAIKRGTRYLDYQWRVIKATDYLEYSKTGNRNIMQEPNSSNNSAISALMMAELAEGKGRFIPQLINGVYFTCEKASWVLSAHLNSLQKSHSSLPSIHEEIIDLGSGEVGAMMSWIYYFFHEEFDKVNKTLSPRLKREIVQRQLLPFIHNNDLWWMARNYQKGRLLNNWTPWCNFNVLQSYMLIENDRDKLANAVYLTIESVDKYLNYIKQDGACEEGPSYWGHAPGKFFDYIELLRMSTGGRVDVMRDPMVRNMGEYIVRSYVGNDYVVNFADASAKADLAFIPVVFRYGKGTDSQLMKNFAAYLDKRSAKTEEQGRYLSAGTDVYRMLATLAIKEELKATQGTLNHPAYTWYPETEFCYMTNKSKMFLAMKGGFNNESHNHNDVGTFSLYINSTPIFIDAGVGTYTKQTFSNERYNIWTMQSNYHNLPLINGIPEHEGVQYKATNTTFNAKQMQFSVDIAKAYPATAQVKTWNRSYRLLKNKVTITDAFELSGAIVANEINFMTWGQVDISKAGQVNIQVKGQKACLHYDANIFIPSLQTVSITDKRLSNVWGNEIIRVTLKAKEIANKGKYNFTITKQ